MGHPARIQLRHLGERDGSASLKPNPRPTRLLLRYVSV